jgi:hypothetical protein
MIKAQRKLGIEGMHINIIKGVYYKPIANIILSGEKLKPFPLTSVERQRCPLYTFLFNLVIIFLARTIRQIEEIKEIQIGKEIVKVSLLQTTCSYTSKTPNTPQHHKQLQQCSRMQNQHTKLTIPSVQKQ